MEKACARCERVKPDTDFPRAGTRARYSYCKECKQGLDHAYRILHKPQANARVARYYRRNSAALLEKQKLRRYGLTAELYAAMVAEQAGMCAICRGEPGVRGLQIDHCHATGVVRGLLCVRCNTSLGKMKDSPALLRAAAVYLEERVNGVLPPRGERWR